MSIVEFNSIEIKERFTKLTTYFPKMSTSSRLICDNIENANLVPEDLLSNGIVNGVLLKKYHKPIRRNLSIYVLSTDMQPCKIFGMMIRNFTIPGT